MEERAKALAKPPRGLNSGNRGTHDPMTAVAQTARLIPRPRPQLPFESTRATSEDQRMKILAFLLALIPAVAIAQTPAYRDPGMKVARWQLSVATSRPPVNAGPPCWA